MYALRRHAVSTVFAGPAAKARLGPGFLLLTEERAMGRNP
eukprot:COSAG02_NODE_664_length_18739_cov_11.071567_21_plen_40_part_00